MLTVILLITSMTAADPEVLEPADTFVAPAVLPIPEELRDFAETMPGDGRWARRVGVAGPAPISGTFLISPLDNHILSRMRTLDRYPGLCQAKIDAARGVADAEKSAIKQVAKADCIIKRIDDQVAVTSEGVPQWVAVLIGLGGVGLGALAALLATR